MLKELDQLELATMIRRAAGRHGFWVVSSVRHLNDRNVRAWWFGRSGKRKLIKKNLTDNEAVVWLQHEDLESLRKWRLHDY